MQQLLDETKEDRDEAEEALAASKSVNAGLDEQIKELTNQLAQVRSKYNAATMAAFNRLG